MLATASLAQEELLKRNELVLREMEALQAEKRREILEQERERLSEIDLLFEEEVLRWRKQCAERLDSIDSDLLRESEEHARLFGLPGSGSSAVSCAADVPLPQGRSPLAPLSESTATSGSRDETLPSGSTTHYAVADIGGQQQQQQRTSPLRASGPLGASSSNPFSRQSQPAPALPSGSPLKRATLDSGNLTGNSFRQSTSMYFPSARSPDAAAGGSHAPSANRTSTVPSSASLDNISQSGSRPTPTKTK